MFHWPQLLPRSHGCGSMPGVKDRACSGLANQMFVPHRRTA
jgi:hypothetical protein